MRRWPLALLVLVGCDQPLAPVVEVALARCVTIAPPPLECPTGGQRGAVAGELFVPHLVLRDLHGLLRAPTANPLQAMPDAALLATFLLDELDVDMDRSLSFLLIDVAASRVAFKKNDDTDARLREVTLWDPVQILHVAGIIQTYLTRKVEILRTVQRLQTDPPPVDQAIAVVAAEWTDPIASERDRADMVLAFRNFVAASPAARGALRQRYPDLDSRLREIDSTANRAAVVETRDRGRARETGARRRFHSIETGFGRALIDAERR
jgi:hypothetical protein